jgi:hypothetical protein
MFMDVYYPEDIEAARQICRIARGFIGRMRARKKCHAAYTRFFDANVNKFYWLVQKTQKTTWKATAWLIKQECPMPVEDQMLYASYLKITALEKLLKEKEKEIKEVRKKRYEDLEPQVKADRLKQAKLKERSKHMDEWTIPDLCNWFTDMKMSEYNDFIFDNR